MCLVTTRKTAMFKEINSMTPIHDYLPLFLILLNYLQACSTNETEGKVEDKITKRNKTVQ